MFVDSLKGKIKNKSQIYGWNISQQFLQVIYGILMFPHQETQTSFKYLGMSISLTNPTIHSWQSVLRK
jgi:hypothetical protein